MTFLRRVCLTLGLFASLAGAASAATVAAGTVRGPYVVADVATGTVYQQFDALRPWYPASTTKLMTIYVAFRAVRAGELALQSPVTYSANAAAQPASKMGFKPGTTLTLDDALKIMMVKSANDIAVAVAETVGGSVERFAGRMNQEAARLGMDRSNFVNPHGLPDERQVTTARDMALLARALLVEFPEYRDYFRVHAIEIGGKVLKNFNPLLERYPGANGMKTGFICASGYNLVASAQRGERQVIAVVLGEYGGAARAEHAAALLDNGFQVAAFSGPNPTLETITSGNAYTSAIDMRPFVCAPGQAAAASEANMQPASASAVADPAEPPPHLGPPIYLGPPIQVSVEPPPKPAKHGEPGFLARLPKPRPATPNDRIQEGVADAFAPNIEERGTDTAPAQAIGAAAGAAAPLQGINPN